MKTFIKHLLMLTGISALALIAPTGRGLHAQTVSGNWTVTRTYTEADNVTHVDDITFYDGFGYAEQVILVGASANTNRNIVTPIEYDNMRRPDTRIYLPFVSAHNDIREEAMSSVFADQADWYDSNGYSGQGEFAFTEKEYDASPLSRVQDTFKAGSTYSRQGDDCPVAFQYSTNGTNEVRMLSVNLSDNSLTISGQYPQGSLLKETATDEDGVSVETYKDNLGRTVMQSIAGFATYYVYDRNGNLGWVVTPEGSLRLSSGTWVIAGESDTNTSNAAKYCYVYSYDGLGRQTSRKMPGRAVEYFVYDNGSRLTMSQDGLQRDGGKWVTYRYDSIGRLVERRLLSSTRGQTYLQDLFARDSEPSEVYSSSATLLESFVYGSYSQRPTTLAFSSVTGVTDAPDQTRITGLKTCEKVAVMSGSTVEGYVERAFYYDALGRLIQTVESDLSGTIGRTSSKYDFTGNIIVSCEQYGQDIKMAWFTFDDRGRLRRDSTVVNGTAVAAMAYAYDDLGRISSSTYGADTPSSAVVRNDVYNIQGWLTSTSYMKGGVPVYEQCLRYYDAVKAAPRYAGDIADWQWKQGSGTVKTYALSYDGAHRLSGSGLFEGASGDMVSYTEKNITYDANGNVKTMKRYGTSSSSPEDDLNFTYAGNRRSTYGYDVNGNITADATTGESYTYGILGNICQAKTGSTVNAVYKYLSDGTKSSGTDASGNGYSYRGSFVYALSSSGSVLESVAFTGGRLVRNGNDYDVEYYLTDHIGSVRSVVRNGSIVQQNDYYPFGGRHANSSLVSLSDNRWLFSGKEDQDVAFNVPSLDFGARQYSPKSVLWLSQDPLAEKENRISQYVYCANNPVCCIDPSGTIRRISIKRNNLLIQANYYVNKLESYNGISAYDATLEATSLLNSLKDLTYTKGDSEYHVKFQLSVFPSYQPETKYTSDVIGNLLSFTNKPLGIDKYGRKIVGETKGRQIIIPYESMDNTLIIVHEILHTLGAAIPDKDGRDRHTTKGIMADVIERQTSELEEESIKQIIEGGEGPDENK